MSDRSDCRRFPYPLRNCVWELTLACCFRCAYCGSSGGVPRDNELTTQECLDVAAQLADMGCARVSLIGGEIFMRPDWEEITAALTSRGVVTCIITNGYRITPEILAALRRVNIESVAVSLDGPRCAHDAFRQEGSYARALAAIETLTGAGIPVSVISTLRADNAPLLPEFYETLRQYPIFAWQLQACSPMGNANRNQVDVRFDGKQVTDFIAAHKTAQPFYICAADNIGYCSPLEPHIRGPLGTGFKGCSAGLQSIGIDSVGNVRGCESMYDERFIEGNLREQTLEQIWTAPHAFAYNRAFTPDLLTGPCAQCPHGDLCAGGCRSYNWFMGGRLYEAPACVSAPDPGTTDKKANSDTVPTPAAAE